MVKKLALKIHIFFALLGITCGIAGFAVFVFVFYNYHAGNNNLYKIFTSIEIGNYYFLKGLFDCRVGSSEFGSLE